MISSEDRIILEENLGREPRGAQEVVARCPTGHPLVVRVASVVAGKPFPTVYWLTCKSVCKQVDAIEASGEIKRLEKDVQDSKELADILKEDHMQYKSLRKEFLSDRDVEYLKENGMYEDLISVGIGGVRKSERIRCLHMMLAYHYARPNAGFLHTTDILSKIQRCHSLSSNSLP